MASKRAMTLTLGEDPMLDPHELAQSNLWVPGNVSRGEYARRARSHQGVDDHTILHAQAGRLGQRRARADAHTHHDEISCDDLAALQLDLIPADRAGVGARSEPLHRDGSGPFLATVLARRESTSEV